jgi:hypothetical protein
VRTTLRATITSDNLTRGHGANVYKVISGLRLNKGCGIAHSGQPLRSGLRGASTCSLSRSSSLLAISSSLMKASNPLGNFQGSGMTYGQRRVALPLEARMGAMAEVPGIARLAVAVRSQ